MHFELIHEKADFIFADLLSELGEPLLELLPVDGLGEDLEMLDALLLGDGRQQCEGGLIEPGLINLNILLRQRPLRLHQRLTSEHRFVQKDQPTTISLGNR